jgi:hypothetical protein
MNRAEVGREKYLAVNKQHRTTTRRMTYVAPRRIRESYEEKSKRIIDEIRAVEISVYATLSQ